MKPGTPKNVKLTRVKPPPLYPEPTCKTRAQRKRWRKAAPLRTATLITRKLEQAALGVPRYSNPLTLSVLRGAGAEVLKRVRLPKPYTERLRRAMLATDNDNELFVATRRLTADDGSILFTGVDWTTEAVTAEQIAQHLRAQGHDAHAVGTHGMSIGAKVCVPKPAQFITLPVSVGVEGDDEQQA